MMTSEDLMLRRAARYAEDYAGKEVWESERIAAADAAALRALAVELAALRRVAEAARAWHRVRYVEDGNDYREGRANRALREAVEALTPEAPDVR